jgi:hypothetical protein
MTGCRGLFLQPAVLLVRLSCGSSWLGRPAARPPAAASPSSTPAAAARQHLGVARAVGAAAGAGRAARPFWPKAVLDSPPRPAHDAADAADAMHDDIGGMPR